MASASQVVMCITQSFEVPSGHRKWPHRCSNRLCHCRIDRTIDQKFLQ
jgi:hypothetical protein